MERVKMYGDRNCEILECSRQNGTWTLELWNPSIGNNSWMSIRRYQRHSKRSKESTSENGECWAKAPSSQLLSWPWRNQQSSITCHLSGGQTKQIRPNMPLYPLLFPTFSYVPKSWVGHKFKKMTLVQSLPGIEIVGFHQISQVGYSARDLKMNTARCRWFKVLKRSVWDCDCGCIMRSNADGRSRTITISHWVNIAASPEKVHLIFECSIFQTRMFVESNVFRDLANSKLTEYGLVGIGCHSARLRVRFHHCHAVYMGFRGLSIFLYDFSIFQPNIGCRLKQHVALLHPNCRLWQRHQDTEPNVEELHRWKGQDWWSLNFGAWNIMKTCLSAIQPAVK